MRRLLGALEESGILLRDIDRGLWTSPRWRRREIYLCWELGEDEVGFWHELCGVRWPPAARLSQPARPRPAPAAGRRALAVIGVAVIVGSLPCPGSASPAGDLVQTGFGGFSFAEGALVLTARRRCCARRSGRLRAAAAAAEWGCS